MAESKVCPDQWLINDNLHANIAAKYIFPYKF